MPQDLSQLTRELQRETCPRRVLDAVQQRIVVEAASPGWLRQAILVAAVALVLACAVSLWQWETRMAQRAALRRGEVARQAEGALGLVGALLAHASAQSEKVISDRAVPPLRNSFQTAKNKIIRHIEL